MYVLGMWCDGFTHGNKKEEEKKEIEKNIYKENKEKKIQRNKW